MYFPMYFDPTYVLVILGVIICLAASAKMRSTFNKYSRVRSRTGMTGRRRRSMCSGAPGSMTSGWSMWVAT